MIMRSTLFLLFVARGLASAVAQDMPSLTVEVSGKWGQSQYQNFTKCAEKALSRELKQAVEFRPLAVSAETGRTPDFVIPTDGVDAIKYADNAVAYQKILDAGSYRTTIASRESMEGGISSINRVDVDISESESLVLPYEVMGRNWDVNVVGKIPDSGTGLSNLMVTNSKSLPNGFQSIWQSAEVVKRPVLARKEFSDLQVTEFQDALAAAIYADRDCFEALDLAEIGMNKGRVDLAVEPRSQLDVANDKDWSSIFGGQVSYSNIEEMQTEFERVHISMSGSDPSASFPVPNSSHKLSNVTIYYVTTRQRGDDLDADRMFLNELSSDGEVSFGKVDVWIPRTHTQGITVRERLFLGVDAESSMNIENLYVVDRSDFYYAIPSRLENGERKELLIYVHGYANSFRDAALRTAQLSYDLKISGPSILFSWPSRARMLSYSRDEDAAAATVPALADLLSEVHEIEGIEKYYIIGHSMGARVLAEALREIEFDRKDTSKFDEIILAAPDININVFKNVIYPRIRKEGRIFTIYAADTDIPLKASRVLNGEAAVGSASGFALRLPGVEVVDVSSIRECGWFCHSTYAETRIIDDIFYLLKDGKRPENRRLNVIAKGFLYKYR